MIVPGVNPPTGIDAEEMTRPIATAAPGKRGDDAVGASDKDVIACPHEEQNRLPVETVVAHEGQCVKGGVTEVWTS
jgi:hypothetical protein